MRVERVDQSFARANELLGLDVGADGNEHAVARKPRPRGPIREHRGARGGIDTIGDPPQRELAQRNEVRLAEEALDCRRDLLRHVDLAGLEPCEQVVGRKVDELDLVCLVEDPVRYRFALPYTRDLRDQIVEAFQMLNVDRRPDVDALPEQLPRCPASVSHAAAPDRHRSGSSARARRRREPRACVSTGVEIEFRGAPCRDTYGQERQLFQALEQTLGLDACRAVRRNRRRHQSRTRARRAASSIAIGFADAGAGTEEDP